jgi:hypothetical protein
VEVHDRSRTVKRNDWHRCAIVAGDDGVRLVELYTVLTDLPE